jgi:predicted metal-dependent peptidase
MNKPPLLQRLSMAKTNLVLDHPFFGSLCTRLKMVERNSEETMATDGINIYYNKTYAENLTDDELVGILAHEVMHPAMNHHTRREERDMERWNQACDYAINPILLKSKFKLPAPGPLYDPAYEGMSAEQIYDKLPKQPGGGGTGKAGQGPRAAGRVIDPAEQDKAGQEADWMVAVKSAAKVAQMMGDLPGDLAHMVEDMLKPKVDWRAQLRQMIQSANVSDYSWDRANRRFMQMGIYMPRLYGHRAPPMIVFWDSSGSTAHAAGKFLAEVNAICDEVRPEQVYVVMCDAGIQQISVFEEGESVKIDVMGMGGTVFDPMFNWLEGRMPELAIQPPDDYSHVVFFTDCEGHWPQRAPDKPLIVASVTDPKQLEGTPYYPPFGQLIYIDEHDNEN